MLSPKSKVPRIKSKVPPINIPDKHYQLITRNDLKKKMASYWKDLDDNETQSCVLSLRDIKFLIDYYSDPQHLNGEKPIDGFRIYFYRPDPSSNQNKGPKTINRVGDKGQLSIILVPTNNFHGKPPLCADNLFDQNDKCWVLTPGGEHTGLCPNNCGGS